MAGKRLPPVATRFPPGVSGNPKGRPKGSKNKRPKLRTSALAETVRFPVNGKLRRMPRREAIVRFALMRALSLQDPKLIAFLLESDQKLQEAQAAVDYTKVSSVIPQGIVWRFENLETAVTRLGLGRLIYPNHPAQRVALAPELVTLAVLRMEDHQLTRDQQKLVVSFTLTPWKVAWPLWWDEDLRNGKCRVPERFFAEEDREWALALTKPPPPPRKPVMIDFEAEYEKERTAYVCKGTGKTQYPPCPECVRAKVKRKSECLQLASADQQEAPAGSASKG